MNELEEALREQNLAEMKKRLAPQLFGGKVDLPTVHNRKVVVL
jgi:hypothetical protein